MEGKNLLAATALIGVIFLLISGAFMMFFMIIPASLEIFGEVIYEDPAYDSSEEYLSFDNSTPEATAISIARLNYGLSGFYNYGAIYGDNGTITASLTSDGKYWIVNMDYSVVTVDAKTWDSIKNDTVDGPYEPEDTWRSLDELKASYIAGIQIDAEEIVGKPQKIDMNGKEIWKIHVYKPIFSNDGTYLKDELAGQVYVDLKTGKSKKMYNDVFNKYYNDIFNIITGSDDWLTLKEVDERSGWYPHPFKNALRNLYPE